MNPSDAEALPYASLTPQQIGLQPPAGGLPDSTRLGTVTLQIADLDRSLAFYRDVIGMDLLVRRDTPGARAAQLGVPGEESVLLELREKPGARFAPHRGRLGLYHLALLLPSRADLGGFLAHAQGLGVHVGQSDHFYSEASYLTDPDGLSVEVYRDRPRADWRVSPQGEILGSGDPLDLKALREAVGDVPWNGLPVGTILGHLHFYVGDLEQAERFYHAGLGFAKVGWSWPAALFVSAGGYHHHLGLNTWAVPSAPSGPDDARLLTWELVLPDEGSVLGVAERLRAQGFTVTPGERGLLAGDPWGIRVRILSGEAEYLPLTPHRLGGVARPSLPDSIQVDGAGSDRPMGERASPSV